MLIDEVPVKIKYDYWETFLL